MNGSSVGDRQIAVKFAKNAVVKVRNADAWAWVTRCFWPYDPSIVFICVGIDFDIYGIYRYISITLYYII